MANNEEKEEIIKTQEIKEKEKKDLNNRVRKSKKEIEKGELGDLVIDRSESYEEVSG